MKPNNSKTTSNSNACVFLFYKHP